MISEWGALQGFIGRTERERDGKVLWEVVVLCYGLIDCLIY